ncbi:hypothetical protein JCM21900_004897 [Sporobolomyces salmonicolor]
MSTLRHRHPARPKGAHAESDPAVLSDASDSLARRPRSHSLYESTHYHPRSGAVFDYRSSLLHSLDLPASFLSLREYLAGKVEEAERGLRALKAYVEAGEAEEELLMSAAETEDDDDDLWEEMRRRRRQRSPSSSPGSSRPASPHREDVEAEISALEQFISSASSFLSTLRAELPSLSPNLSNSPSASFLQFQLSPEARDALDRFLEDHPLPSLPHFGFRSRAASSANALLARVTTELRTLQDALAYLTTPSDPSAPTMSSYIPSLGSLPPMPSPPVPDFSDLRTYFSNESTRLSNAVSLFKDETTESLSAGLHQLSDGAAELSAYVKDQSSAALDEAVKIYHRALEIGKERLLRYEELPHEWRNNEHILSGYRYIPIEQWGTLLRSGWQWHNETINIQSHFLGFLSLVGLLIYYLSSTPSPSSSLAEAATHPGDTAIAILFVAAGMKCLLCSAAWHLLSGCATSHWFRGAACVDYVGISGLIAASVMGAEYYGFYDHPNLAMGYMVFSSIIGITGMIVPWSAWFNQRQYKTYRIAFFVALAASAVAPIAHRSILHGFGDTFGFYSPAVPSVAAYLVGLLFYAHQFPECCSPGHWHFGASHNIWHFSIVIAVWLHWRAMSIWSSAVNSAALMP